MTNPTDSVPERWGTAKEGHFPGQEVRGVHREWRIQATVSTLAAQDEM